MEIEWLIESTWTSVTFSFIYLFIASDFTRFLFLSLIEYDLIELFLDVQYLLLLFLT